MMKEAETAEWPQMLINFINGTIIVFCAWKHTVVVDNPHGHADSKLHKCTVLKQV